VAQHGFGLEARRNDNGTYAEPAPGRPIVQYQPKARKVAPAPQEVPVVHSSAYLLRRNKPEKSEKPVLASTSGATPDDEQQNAMEWALRQADAYFDRVEADQESHSTARVLVKNPATQVTMKTMQVTP
jgi:hypothetical protein